MAGIYGLNVGVQAYADGQWTEAAELYAQARENCLRAGDRQNAALAGTNLGELLVSQGRLDEAERVLTDARRVLRSSGYTAFALFAEVQLARCALDRADAGRGASRRWSGSAPRPQRWATPRSCSRPVSISPTRTPAPARRELGLRRACRRGGGGRRGDGAVRRGDRPCARRLPRGARAPGPGARAARPSRRRGEGTGPALRGAARPPRACAARRARWEEPPRSCARSTASRSSSVSAVSPSRSSSGRRRPSRRAPRSVDARGRRRDRRADQAGRRLGVGVRARRQHFPGTGRACRQSSADHACTAACRTSRR